QLKPVRAADAVVLEPRVVHGPVRAQHRVDGDDERAAAVVEDLRADAPDVAEAVLHAGAELCRPGEAQVGIADVVVDLLARWRLVIDAGICLDRGAIAERVARPEARIDRPARVPAPVELVEAQSGRERKRSRGHLRLDVLAPELRGLDARESG